MGCSLAEKTQCRWVDLSASALDPASLVSQCHYCDANLPNTSRLNAIQWTEPLAQIALARQEPPFPAPVRLPFAITQDTIAPHAINPFGCPLRFVVIGHAPNGSWIQQHLIHPMAYTDFPTFI